MNSFFIVHVTFIDGVCAPLTQHSVDEILFPKSVYYFELQILLEMRTQSTVSHYKFHDPVNGWDDFCKIISDNKKLKTQYHQQKKKVRKLRH